MLSAARRAGRLSLLVLMGASLGSPALATPLNLDVGDVVEVMSFDVFKRITGDGGTYTWDGANGVASGDGQVTSVTVEPSNVKNLDTLGVELHFDANFDFQSILGPPFGGNNNLLFMQGNFSNLDPTAFEMTQTGFGTILEANITFLTISGIVNLLEVNNPTIDITLLVGANLTITGGNTALTDAMGGVGGTAILELTSTIFNFDPGYEVVASNGNFFDDNLTFAMSGTIRPTSSSEFVPEPSTAILVGGGMLGLLAASRRARNRNR